MEAEVIVGLLTFGGWALTIVKIYRQHTSWYWNLAPMLVGATTVMWMAKIIS